MPMLDYFEIERMPTLCVGQAADLKIDTGTIRVWISRCGIADGETQPVQVERLIDGRWVDESPTDGRSRDVMLDGEYAGLYVHAYSRLLRER